MHLQKISLIGFPQNGYIRNIKPGRLRVQIFNVSHFQAQKAI